MNFKNGWWVEEGIHKGHMLYPSVYIKHLGKSIEIEKLVLARVWGTGRMSVTANGFGIPFYLNENILKLYDGEVVPICE